MSINIQIENCNNIDNGNIVLKENKLNIKYGINGTGKSTIAKAIKNHNAEEKLKQLTPFKSNSDVAVFSFAGKLTPFTVNCALLSNSMVHANNATNTYFMF